MLNRLRIVPAERIIAFEEITVDRLVEAAGNIEREGRLRNPLLVRQLDDKFLVLDDATTFAALKKLGISHVPVQIAGIKALSVRPWQRIIEKWHLVDLLKFCRLFPRQIIVEENKNGRLGFRQAEIRFRDRTSVRLTFVSKSFPVRIDLYIKFMRSFMNRCRNFRAKLDYNDRDPLAAFPQATAAIYPPTFSIDELSELARRRWYLPQGLVRVDQPGRVFGIDYSLSILKEAVPVEEKQAFLTELIRIRMSSDRTAYFDGYVFVINS